MHHPELNASPSLNVAVLASGLRRGRMLLFHEPWWLSAAAGDQLIDVSVDRGNQLSGRLSFISTKSRFGLRILRMPSFTHVLGPVIDTGHGKRQTRLINRLSIVRELLDQLPACDFFQVAIDPSLDDGLAFADGLAFQERGFRITPQYTFQINCHKAIDEIWAAMSIKARQPIRRAQERYVVCELNDSRKFVEFYMRNLKTRLRKSHVDFTRFPLLFSECSSRNCGTILAALRPNGEPAAMIFIVWGHGMLYYTLSTRAIEPPENGCVNLLIWSAIKKAHELKLTCDLDGIISAGTARFLGHFGGELGMRLVATYSRPLYRAIRYLPNKFDLIANEAAKFS
jgi:Acetyltransferase (GNAT) domain